MAIQPTHKPDQRDVDAAWDENRARALDAAWDRYKDRRAEADRAESDYHQALEDPTSNEGVERAHLNAHAQAQDALEEAAATLRRLGEDPEVYDQGEEPWYPTPHGII